MERRPYPGAALENVSGNFSWRMSEVHGTYSNCPGKRWFWHKTAMPRRGILSKETRKWKRTLAKAGLHRERGGGNIIGMIDSRWVWIHDRSSKLPVD